MITFSLTLSYLQLKHRRFFNKSDHCQWSIKELCEYCTEACSTLPCCVQLLYVLKGQAEGTAACRQFYFGPSYSLHLDLPLLLWSVLNVLLVNMTVQWTACRVSAVNCVTCLVCLVARTPLIVNNNVLRWQSLRTHVRSCVPKKKELKGGRSPGSIAVAEDKTKLYQYKVDFALQ